MGRSIKQQSNWCAYTRKLLSFLRVFKNLSLIWRHPIATLCVILFVLLLFITPTQTIIRFFSPLIVCTILCMVAFISFGSLMDKNENQTSHIQGGYQVTGLDVLGLGEGWAPYNGFQSHSMFTRDSDPNFLSATVRSKTCFETKNEAFGLDRLERDGDYQSGSSRNEGIGLSFLNGGKTQVQHEDLFAGMDRQERDGGWTFETHDALRSAKSSLKQKGSLSSLAKPVIKRDNKTHVRFMEDIVTMDQKGGDEDRTAQMNDEFHSNIDPREEDGQSTLNLDQIQDDYSPLTEEIEEKRSHVQMEDAGAGLDEQGRDREWDSQMYGVFQQDSNFKLEDGLSSVMEKTNEIGSEIQTEEVGGIDMASDFNLEFHESDSKNEDDPIQESDSEVQMVDNRNGMDVLDHQLNLAAESYVESQSDSNSEHESEVQMEDNTNGMDVLDHQLKLAAESYIESQSDSNPEHESEVEQKRDGEVQMEDTTNGMDVFDHHPNLAAESIIESQSDSNPEHESEGKQNSDSEDQMGMDVLGHDSNLAVESYNDSQSDSNPKLEIESKQEIDTAMQIGDKINDMYVVGHDENLAAELDHELHSFNNPKVADDLKQVPQKWRDWVRGVETDGLSIRTSEKDFFKNFDESTICTNFGQEITGSTTLEEEFTSNGAFIAVEETGDVLLKELSSFLRELAVKLQTFQVEAGQARGANEFAEQKDKNLPACPVTEATRLKSAEFSPRNETLDDSNTEEGDASSRWDEALDTSEKESADSENEEERIWPLSCDGSDLGAAITGKEFNNLKQEYSALEKEYKALQHQIGVKLSDQNVGTQQTGEDKDDNSDDSLDPYVKLFAQCASDAEDELLDHLHPEQHQAATISKTESSRASTARDRSSQDTKRRFRKPMILSIGRAIRAIKGKKL